VPSGQERDLPDMWVTSLEDRALVAWAKSRVPRRAA
jgi:hypothetical protein